MTREPAKITQLCASWRERLADDNREGQREYAEAFLRLLGWETAAPFSLKAGPGVPAALPYVMRAAGQTAVAAYFVMPGTLQPPSAIVDAGLDFCPATRVLAGQARTLNVGYMLATDSQRSYLYDVRTDELLLFADDPRAFAVELAPALAYACVERGGLEELRREPRSTVARRLREWGVRWARGMAKAGAVSEERAILVIDRLLVVRYLFDRDILRRTRWRLQQRFTGLVDEAQAEIPGVGRRLVHLFHDMWFDWRIDIFEGSRELDAILEDDRIAMPLLREFALMSRTRFSMATILESFNHGDPQEKMRVRMVPDMDEDREMYLNRQRIETVDQARIEVDVVDEGYRAVFHWFDKLVALYERLEDDFENRSRRHADQGAAADLFAWSAIDAARPGALGDKLAYACEHGLRVFYKGSQQYRVTRLMLTLHLISRYAEAHSPVNTLPSVNQMLEDRPQGLDMRRLMALEPGNRDHIEFYR